MYGNYICVACLRFTTVQYVRMAPQPAASVPRGGGGSYYSSPAPLGVFHQGSRTLTLQSEEFRSPVTDIRGHAGCCCSAAATELRKSAGIICFYPAS